ncbi:MAG: DHH family phosphoesterase [Acidobacteriota bacterium]
MTDLEAVVAAIRERQSFILTSHAKPDGDAVGSSLALALALEHLGKQATVILKDPAPEPYRSFPSVDRITIAARATTPADAVVVLECSELDRPGVAGLERYFVINVDHHLGNTMYGHVNWFDGAIAACGEMVADIIDALEVPWTREIASHLYLAISTDTGGFRYGAIRAKTFDTCRRIVEAGVDAAALSRQIFDSYSIGRVKLTGAMLDAMTLHHHRQLAVLAFDEDLLNACGAKVDDTEGLVNIPLSAREVTAVVLFKRQDARTFRLSLRSKGQVDVRAVAAQWQGGGHRNAAGCTIVGEFAEVRDAIVDAMALAIDVAAAADAVPAR